VKIEWERDDSVFISVSPVVLFWLPIFKYFIISANEVIGTFFTSFTKTPFSGDSRNYSLHF
jgi:hypothetical protein